MSNYSWLELRMLSWEHALKKILYVVDIFAYPPSSSPLKCVAREFLSLEPSLLQKTMSSSFVGDDPAAPDRHHAVAVYFVLMHNVVCPHSRESFLLWRTKLLNPMLIIISRILQTILIWLVNHREDISDQWIRTCPCAGTEGVVGVVRDRFLVYDDGTGTSAVS